VRADELRVRVGVARTRAGDEIPLVGGRHHTRITPRGGLGFPGNRIAACGVTPT
jgi:hypothetical protein